MPPKSTRAGEYIETENGNKISRRAQLHSTPHIVLAGKTVIQHDVVIRGDLVRQQQQQQQQQQPPSSSSSDPAAATAATTKPAGDKPSTSTSTSTSTSSSSSSSSQLVSIHLGRYVFISAGCTLHPPSRLSSSSSSSSSSTNPPTHRDQPTAPSLATNPTPQLLHYPLRISSHVYLGPSTHCAAASIGSHVLIGSRCVIGNLVIIKDCVRVEDDTVLPANTVWRSGVVVAGKPGRVVGELGDGWVDGGLGAGGAGAGGGGAGGSGGSASQVGGMEGWTRELWSSVGGRR